jgi:hypothetical protein
LISVQFDQIFHLACAGQVEVLIQVLRRRFERGGEVAMSTSRRIPPGLVVCVDTTATVASPICCPGPTICLTESGLRQTNQLTVAISTVLANAEFDLWAQRLDSQRKCGGRNNIAVTP